MKLKIKKCIDLNNVLISLQNVQGFSIKSQIIIAKNMKELEIVQTKYNENLQKLKGKYLDLISEFKDQPEKYESEFAKLWIGTKEHKEALKLSEEEIDIELNKIDMKDLENVSGLVPGQVFLLMDLIQE